MSDRRLDHCFRHEAARDAGSPYLPDVRLFAQIVMPGPQPADNDRSVALLARKRREMQVGLMSSTGSIGAPSQLTGGLTLSRPVGLSIMSGTWDILNPLSLIQYATQQTQKSGQNCTVCAANRATGLVIVGVRVKPTLTLVTCYPFSFVGAAPQRYIVRAHRISE